MDPIIVKINDDLSSLDLFCESIGRDIKRSEVLLEFPTVYIHNWKESEAYEVYIGETNNIIQRTRQHFETQGQWQEALREKKAILYIIGHDHFNKSMTLDIEERLMLYLMGAERVRRVHNARGNPQRRYYPDFEMNGIFQKIWSKLRKYNKELFPKESEIKDSAVFKASPLHRLTDEQERVKEAIINKVFEMLEKDEDHQLIFIEGAAGTGKTVLNSSTFYDIYSYTRDGKDDHLKCCMIVNHDEQITVYEQIAKKLGLLDRDGETIVCKPTTFINNHSKENQIDVAFVDEAHLLLTQGKQSYRGKNQLKDIIERARITVVMFDEKQILTTEQYWEQKDLDYFKNMAKRQNNFFELKTQLRMQAPRQIVGWIDDFTNYQRLSRIPKDKGNYEIKIFNDPDSLEKAIKEKAVEENHKLSRIIATYDWEYSSSRDSKNALQKYWEVTIGNWHKPWNYELGKKLDMAAKKKNKSLAWAEQSQTINEIGSTFTIQGFDLNYAGVILGPSVKYRNGKIVFDPKKSCNRKAVRRRTLSDGTKKKFGETFIQHEVRILMTRGVEGLYIYACDPDLREALKKASE